MESLSAPKSATEGVCMSFAVLLRHALVAIAAVSASAALVYFGNGMKPLWPLMWWAPLPVLLFALARPAWQGAVAAALAWLLGSLNIWAYFNILGLPVAGWLPLSGVGAGVFAAAVLITRALQRRGALWSAWLALPALWVSFEYVRNLLWPHGSAGSVAYSQLNFLPFLQWASVAGPWGMGFVLLLFPAGLALALHQWRMGRSPSRRLAGATLAVTAAVLLFGVARLQGTQPGPQVRVGLAAYDAQLGVAPPGAATQQLLAQYAQTAAELTARGAQVVVLPENLGVVLDGDAGRAAPDSAVGRIDGLLQGLADRSGAVLVAGMTYATSRSSQHNEARIYQPASAVRTYDKVHLLPPGESQYTPGTSRTLLQGRDGKPWGVAICKDYDFTEPARSYGRAGVGLMLAPAWDFRMDEFYHGHIAAMRAVEDGFSLVRAAKNGFLTVADDRGRIVAEASSNAAPFATLVADVRTGHDTTLFVRLGDWFGGVALALLALVLARLSWLSNRSAAPAKAPAGGLPLAGADRSHTLSGDAQPGIGGGGSGSGS